MTLTLKSFPKVKIFETYELKKTVKGEGESQPKCQIQNFKVKGQGRAKGQIRLIGHNFASDCHRDFKLGSYFSLRKAAPNMTSTLTLKSLPKVKIFETSIKENSKGEGQSQPKCQIQNVSVRGQGQSEGQIHLIGYNFASNCHRDFKFGSYVKLMKSCIKYDLDLEKFAQGLNF